MTKKIFRAICVASISVLVITLMLIMWVLYSRFSNTQISQLKMQTDMAVRGVNLAGEEYFKDLNTEQYRITWVDASGNVLFDSHENTADMENHLEREEIKRAFATGSGESKRYSSTLMERSLYYAKRLNDGTVIRLSMLQSSVLTLLLQMIQPILIILFGVIILSIILANQLAKSIITPLNAINLDNPLENEGYDELSPLLRRIYSQQEELKRQSDMLQRKTDELDAVIGSMREGIVLLNTKNQIIGINNAAIHLLEVDGDPIGKDIVLICRNIELQKILEKAQGGAYEEKLVNLSVGTYQMDASPVISGKDVVGVALLFFDVTEKERAEQMRREFTANVSHELKTPLHSITGYSELMANGMVKPEDYTAFAEKIYIEGKRMVQLVEDIINLSHLDEGGGDMVREDVDIYSLAEGVINSLSAQAKNADVQLSLSGRPTVLKGVPQLLSGIIFNLCDNAIKYNRKGGNVQVEIAEDASNVILSVKDTGIGIPKECQNRIYERFYRVDKSHSKEVGGTGLGLSIVKHAAKIHNGSVELSSEDGKGTTVTVKFPKQ